MKNPLAHFDAMATAAVINFWRCRTRQKKSQAQRGQTDAGARGAVTGGKQMDGFVELFVELALRAGAPEDCIHKTKRSLPLPGYYRASKEWDLLIVIDHRLVAAFELKSQVGSFGNNFNNRTEEAMGSALDLWTAFREGVLGTSHPPFLGWLMLIEDAPGSRTPVRVSEPHFPVLPDFHDASYIRRYELFCRKLVLERQYTATALLTSEYDSGRKGEYAEPASDISLRTFATVFVEHIRAAVSIGG